MSKGLTFIKKWKWWIYNIFEFLCIFNGFLNCWGCFFVETAACSHRCPLRHPAPSLRHWYTGVYLRIFNPRPSNPTIFLRFYSSGDYRQSIESPMDVPTFNSTEKALTFTIYDCILRIRPKKMCYLTKVSPLDVELISVECAVPVYRLTTSKGLGYK